MTDAILVSARVGETRVALTDGDSLVELHVFRDLAPHLTGNIYKAVIRSLAPEFEGAFLELEPGLSAFMAFKKQRPVSLTEGQSLLVRVTKAAVGSKPVEVSGRLELGGRLVQYRPHATTHEISGEIPKDIKQELLAFLATLPDLKGGVRLREAVRSATKTAVIAEINALQALWADIAKAADKAKAPRCIYREPHPALAFVRDHLTDAVKSVVFDRADLLAEAKQRLDGPFALDNSGDIFQQSGVDRQIDAIMSPRVSLPGGGWITIEETEALTAIDVNAGSPTHVLPAAELAFHTNLEAAREIIRQLRLRQIGGLVVIDFIDMANRGHGFAVLAELDKLMARDPAPLRRSGFSTFGLVELTRRKSGPSLTRQLTIRPPAAPTLETSGLQALRAVEASGAKTPGRAMILEVDAQTADWLNGAGAGLVGEVQKRIGASVDVQSRADFARGQANAYIK